jgi:phosphonate transport system ATP-binding protein
MIPAADPSVVAAAAVSKRYPNGTLALSDFSARIGRGEMVAVLGPSGAGKTTLFRLCNGSVRPTSGVLEVLGHSMTRLRGSELQRLRRRVAVVYQNHNLVGSLSVLQNVLIGRLGRVSLLTALRSAFLPGNDEVGQVYALLNRLGIPDKLLTRVDDLSGGQKQRVAIARALIQSPELLLADEPVASVDHDTATVILELLAATCRDQGTSVLVSLHQHQYVERYCHRVLDFRAGKLVRDAYLAASRGFPAERSKVAP